MDHKELKQILKEQKKQLKLDQNENYLSGIEEFKKLQEMGIIKKQEYSISRPDNIGYTRFGHISY